MNSSFSNSQHLPRYISLEDRLSDSGDFGNSTRFPRSIGGNQASGYIRAIMAKKRGLPPLNLKKMSKATYHLTTSKPDPFHMFVLERGELQPRSLYTNIQQLLNQYENRPRNRAEPSYDTSFFNDELKREQIQEIDRNKHREATRINAEREREAIRRREEENQEKEEKEEKEDRQDIRRVMMKLHKEAVEHNKKYRNPETNKFIDYADGRLIRLDKDNYEFLLNDFLDRKKRGDKDLLSNTMAVNEAKPIFSFLNPKDQLELGKVNKEFNKTYKKVKEDNLKNVKDISLKDILKLTREYHSNNGRQYSFSRYKVGDIRYLKAKINGLYTVIAKLELIKIIKPTANYIKMIFKLIDFTTISDFNIEVIQDEIEKLKNKLNLGREPINAEFNIKKHYGLDDGPIYDIELKPIGSQFNETYIGYNEQIRVNELPKNKRKQTEDEIDKFIQIKK